MALALALVLGIMQLVLGVRLLLTEGALPPRVWAEEIETLNAGDVAYPPRPGWIETISWRNSSGDVLWGRYLTCRAENAEGGAAQRSECLALLERIVSLAPASSRQWLEIAILRAVDEGASERVFAALDMSCMTGAQEAWIAVTRVQFGLRLWPALPDRTSGCILNDLSIVTASWQLSIPLLDAYIADPMLRANTATALAQADAEVGSRMVRMIRRRMRGETATQD